MLNFPQQILTNNFFNFIKHFLPFGHLSKNIEIRVSIFFAVHHYKLACIEDVRVDSQYCPYIADKSISYSFPDTGFMQLY